MTLLSLRTIFLMCLSVVREFNVVILQVLVLSLRVTYRHMTVLRTCRLLKLTLMVPVLLHIKLICNRTKHVNLRCPLFVVMLKSLRLLILSIMTYDLNGRTITTSSLLRLDGSGV